MDSSDASQHAYISSTSTPSVDALIALRMTTTLQVQPVAAFRQGGSQGRGQVVRFPWKMRAVAIFAGLLAMLPLWVSLFASAHPRVAIIPAVWENARNGHRGVDAGADAPGCLPRRYLTMPAGGSARAPEPPSDEERQQRHAPFNDRISYSGEMAAPVVAASAPRRSSCLSGSACSSSFMGLCLPVALLAIAMLC